VQVAIFVGYLRCGFWGAWASGWALILPASVMVALLATAYVHLHGLPWLTAITYGVSPAVIALILQSWWRLVRLGMEDRFQYVIAAVSVMATLVLPGILTAVFLGAGLLGVGWYSLQARRRAAAPRLHDVASFVLLAKMAWFFLITGAFTFGGGLAVVPLLQKGLVEQGWFSSRRRHSCAIAPIRSCRVSSRASDRRGRFGCAAALPHQRSAPGRIGGGRRPGDVPIPAPRLDAGSLAACPRGVLANVVIIANGPAPTTTAGRNAVREVEAR
jgi:chromate transport protein ChrA